jgi:hypothetical protein
MKTLLTALALALAISAAHAQAPGGTPTGEWQCGPHVRITVSFDGRDGQDWLVKGAWFDNHYTVRRGQLFYNGAPCLAVGEVWPIVSRRIPVGVPKATKAPVDPNGDCPDPALGPCE